MRIDSDIRTSTESLPIRIIKLRWVYVQLGILFISLPLIRNPRLDQWWSLSRTAKDLWDNVGIVAVIAGGFSLALFVIRIGWTIYRRRRWATMTGMIQQVVVELLKWFRSHHVFFGWIAFGVALAHSAYFVTFPRGTPLKVYSGLIGFVAMTFLVGLGVMVQYMTAPLKLSRTWHLRMGLGLAFVLFLHILF